MATWRSIAASEYAVNAPGTAQWADAVSNNPVAITEGATGAPRNVLKSIEDLVAGDDNRSQDTHSTAGSAFGIYEEVHSFGFIQRGTIRCYIERTGGSSSPSNAARVTRTRNGTTTTLATANEPYTLDVSVIPGDVVALLGQDGTTSITYTAYFRTDNTNLWPAGGAIVEGNDV
jgi:hypothetical protein